MVTALRDSALDILDAACAVSAEAAAVADPTLLIDRMQRIANQLGAVESQLTP